MDPRFVTRTMHAYLDYPVALSLMTAPFLIGLGSSAPLALWLAVSTGVAALILTLFTDHRLGVFRVVPWCSGILSRFSARGAVNILAPMENFNGRNPWCDGRSWPDPSYAPRKDT